MTQHLKVFGVGMDVAEVVANLRKRVETRCRQLELDFVRLVLSVRRGTNEALQYI